MNQYDAEIARLLDDGCPHVEQRQAVPIRLDDYRPCDHCGLDCPFGSPVEPCHGDVTVQDVETWEHTCLGHDVWGRYRPRRG